MKKFAIPFFISLFLITACASTKIESIKNDEVNFYDYKKILVFCNTEDISLRKKFENHTVNEFNKYGKTSESSITIFPPLKNYSETEINNLIEKNNFDSILIFSPLSADKTYSGSAIIPIGNFAMAIPSYEKIHIYDIEFKDLKNNVLILKSTSRTSEEDIFSVSKSIAKKVVSEIMKNEYLDLYKKLQDIIKQEFKNATFIGNDKKSKFMLEKEIATFSVKNDGILINLLIDIKTKDSLFKIKTTQNSETYSYTLASYEEIEKVVNELKRIIK